MLQLVDYSAIKGSQLSAFTAKLSGVMSSQIPSSKLLRLVSTWEANTQGKTKRKSIPPGKTAVSRFLCPFLGPQLPGFGYSCFLDGLSSCQVPFTWPLMFPLSCSQVCGPSGLLRTHPQGSISPYAPLCLGSIFAPPLPAALPFSRVSPANTLNHAHHQGRMLAAGQRLEGRICWVYTDRCQPSFKCFNCTEKQVA